LAASRLQSGASPATLWDMPLPSDDFYRIKKLPPYVFAVINELKV
jgi:hypothetical protein